MTHRPIEDILRDADLEHAAHSNDRSADRTARLWQRVSTGLGHDVPDEIVGQVHVSSGQVPAASPLRVVHRAGRERRFRLVSVAATLLVLFAVGWWLSSPSGDLGAPELVETVESSASERKSLEGELELEGVSSPVLRRDLYEGVVVKNGDQSVDALRVCSPC